MQERFVCTLASQLDVADGRPESVAVRRPSLALDGYAQREHARRPVEITTKIVW